MLFKGHLKRDCNKCNTSGSSYVYDWYPREKRDPI